VREERRWGRRYETSGVGWEEGRRIEGRGSRRRRREESRVGKGGRDREERKME
jgi:hypothetical protein